MAKRRPPTALEREILGAVLVELRGAMRRREQFTLHIDPFLLGGGTYIFAAPNPEGHTYEFNAPSKRRGGERG